MREGFSKLVVLALLWTVLPAIPVWTQDDPSRKAVQAIEQFVAACKAKDLEEVMKAVDAPYHFGGDKIIRERDKLRALMKAEIEAATEMAPFKHKVARVQRYKDFRPSVSD